MKINNLNNYSQIFNGKFYYNHLLEKSLQNANDYELKRFSNVMERLVKSGDRHSFVLKEKRHYSSDSIVCNLILKDNNSDIKEFLSYDELNICSAEQSNPPRFKNALESINNILEKIYPAEHSDNINRNTLIESIKKLLI